MPKPYFKNLDFRKLKEALGERLESLDKTLAENEENESGSICDGCRIFLRPNEKRFTCTHDNYDLCLSCIQHLPTPYVRSLSSTAVFVSTTSSKGNWRWELPLLSGKPEVHLNQEEDTINQLAFLAYSFDMVSSQGTSKGGWRLFPFARNLMSQMQTASTHWYPTISVIGPTKVGKSTLVKKLLESYSQILESKEDEKSSESTSTPLVAQNSGLSEGLPTSSDITAWKVKTSSEGPYKKVRILDFEGKDAPNQIPITWNHGEAFKLKLGDDVDGAMAKRRDCVQNFFSRIAYCMSDIIIFIDTREIQDKSYFEEMQKVATTAQQNFVGQKLKPTLIVIQNKTTCEKEEKWKKLKNWRKQTKTFLGDDHMLDEQKMNDFLEGKEITGNFGTEIEKHFEHVYAICIPNMDSKKNPKAFDEQIEVLKKEILEPIFLENSKRPQLSEALWLGVFSQILDPISEEQIIDMNKNITDAITRSQLIKNGFKLSSIPAPQLIESCFNRFKQMFFVNSMNFGSEMYELVCQESIDMLVLLALSSAIGVQVFNSTEQKVAFRAVIESLHSKEVLHECFEKLAQLSPCGVSYTGKDPPASSKIKPEDIICCETEESHGNRHKSFHKVKSNFFSRTDAVWDGQFDGHEKYGGKEMLIQRWESTYNQSLEKFLAALFSVTKSLDELMKNVDAPENLEELIDEGKNEALLQLLLHNSIGHIFKMFPEEIRPIICKMKKGSLDFCMCCHKFRLLIHDVTCLNCIKTWSCPICGIGEKDFDVEKAIQLERALLMKVVQLNLSD